MAEFREQKLIKFQYCCSTKNWSLPFAPYVDPNLLILPENNRNCLLLYFLLLGFEPTKTIDVKQRASA